MGVVAVAGMPEVRINLEKKKFWLALSGYHLHRFCQLQYYDSFFLSLSPGKTLNF